MYAYLVLRGKVHLNPQFANLSSSSMGAIGPGITYIDDVLEFPEKRMSKDPKYIPVPHTRGGLHGAGAVIFRVYLLIW